MSNSLSTFVVFLNVSTFMVSGQTSLCRLSAEIFPSCVLDNYKVFPFWKCELKFLKKSASVQCCCGHLVLRLDVQFLC